MKTIFSIMLMSLLGLCLVSEVFARDPAILEAAKKGDTEAVRQCLAKGEDVNARGEWWHTPLISAVGSGNVEMTKLLLDHGAKVWHETRDGMLSYNYVCVYAPNQESKGRIIALMDEARLKQLDRDRLIGQSPLTSAVIAGDAEKARKLIEEGADINARDQAGWSPLMHAAARADAEMCRLLVEKGAQLQVYKDKKMVSSIKDNDGISIWEHLGEYMEKFDREKLSATGKIIQEGQLAEMRRLREKGEWEPSRKSRTLEEADKNYHRDGK